MKNTINMVARRKLPQLLSQTAKAVAISALALNLSGCSLFTNPAADAGGGGKAVLTLLAAAVPVGAIVAISNNDDSPTPARMTMNNNGGGMTGTGGGTLPTTTINSNPTDNGDGTITWTVTFSRSISGITANDFSVSGGTVTSVSPMSGTTVMVTTTHTSAGSITLSYTGAGAQDETSPAVAFTVPTFLPTAQDINYLADLNRLANAASVSSSNSADNIRYRISEASGTTTLHLGTSGNLQAYTFPTASVTNRNGFLVSSGNDLLVLREQGTGTGVVAFYVGDNIEEDGEQPSFSSVHITNYGEADTTRTPSANIPTGEVTYTGNYILATVPSGDDIADGINRGRFSIVLDYDHPIADTQGAFDGEAFNSADEKVGDFSMGRLSVSGGVIIQQLRFDGLANTALAGVQDVRLNGSVIGATANTYAGQIIASGRTSAVVPNTTHHAVMGIVGSRQASN